MNRPALVLAAPFIVAWLLAPSLGCSSSRTSGVDGGHGSDGSTEGDAATNPDGGGALDGGSITDGQTQPDGGSPFAGAYLIETCGPDGGAGLQILLYAVPVPECSADLDRPSLTINLYEGADLFFPITDGETVTSTASHNNGSASYCPGGEAPCRVTGDWAVTFTSYAEGGSAMGTYSLTFPDDEMTGDFDALLCTGFGPPDCG